MPQLIVTLGSFFPTGAGTKGEAVHAGDPLAHPVAMHTATLALLIGTGVAWIVANRFGQRGDGIAAAHHLPGTAGHV